MLLLFYILPVICYKFKMLVFVWFLAMLVARGLLALRPGIEPCAPNNGGTVLTTELPGKSLLLLALNSQLYPTLCDLMDCSLPGSSVHGILRGKDTGVGCHSLLQGIFPDQVWTQVSCIGSPFLGDSVVKNPPTDARDVGSISGSGSSPGGGNGYPFQYSCRKNPIDREAWPATVHRIAKNLTTEWACAHTHTHTHTHTYTPLCCECAVWERWLWLGAQGVRCRSSQTPRLKLKEGGWEGSSGSSSWVPWNSARPI